MVKIDPARNHLVLVYQSRSNGERRLEFQGALEIKPNWTLSFKIADSKEGGVKKSRIDVETTFEWDHAQGKLALFVGREKRPGAQTIEVGGALQAQFKNGSLSWTFAYRNSTAGGQSLLTIATAVEFTFENNAIWIEYTQSGKSRKINITAKVVQENFVVSGGVEIAQDPQGRHLGAFVGVSFSHGRHRRRGHVDAGGPDRGDLRTACPVSRTSSSCAMRCGNGPEMLAPVRGDWDLVWGPVTSRVPLGVFDSNAMYVVRHRREGPPLRGGDPRHQPGGLVGLALRRSPGRHHGAVAVRDRRRPAPTTSTALGLAILQEMRARPLSTAGRFAEAAVAAVGNPLDRLIRAGRALVTGTAEALGAQASALDAQVEKIVAHWSVDPPGRDAILQQFQRAAKTVRVSSTPTCGANPHRRTRAAGGSTCSRFSPNRWRPAPSPWR